MNLKKIVGQKCGTALMCGFAAAMMMGATAMAESTPGVTVTADENSPTGYTATFVYENAEASEVKLMGTFSFYTRGYGIGVVPETYYGPEEWEPGMFRAGFGDIGPWEGIMEKEEGTDYWTISIPLPSGHYEYFYNIDGAEENIEDPANPAMVADTENGGTTRTSVFDVPYDAEKQIGSVDFSFMLPREDIERGELSFVNYEDINGDTQSLGIYLPAGYDPEAEEPYKVMYLCHGMGGNEIELFDHASVNVIFDNLIADGDLEPTLSGTMNNSVYGEGSDYDTVIKNLMEYVIPYVEENYNVVADPSGRAVGGTSMGGMTTSNIYYTHPDEFSYFFLNIGADASTDLSTLDIEKMQSSKVVFGGGLYDILYNRYRDMMANMDAVELPYTFYLADGGHDYASTVPQTLHLFAKNNLWK